MLILLTVEMYASESIKLKPLLTLTIFGLKIKERCRVMLEYPSVPFNKFRSSFVNYWLQLI